MNLKEFYDNYKSEIDESMVKRVRQSSSSSLNSDVDSQVFSIRNIKEFRDNFVEFIELHKDWFIPLKMSKIHNLLKTQENIDLDKIYILDLKGELAENKGIPDFCKFFKYFDDEIFMIGMHFDISPWDEDDKDFTQIGLQIYAKKENDDGVRFYGDIPCIGEIHLNTNYFEEKSPHIPVWDYDSCFASSNKDVFLVCLKVIEKLKNDIQGFLSFCPPNKEFVREMYWDGRFNADKDKLQQQEIFSRPLLKWMNR